MALSNDGRLGLAYTEAQGALAIVSEELRLHESIVETMARIVANMEGTLKSYTALYERLKRAGVDTPESQAKLVECQAVLGRARGTASAARIVRDDTRARLERLQRDADILGNTILQRHPQGLAQ